MTRLDSSSPVPLYHQIELGLLDLVRSRGLERGSALPSEPELAAEFGVARLTVRRAIERLVQQGVLVRRRGVGTFVADPGRAQAAASRTRHLFLILPNMSSIVHLRTLAGAQEEARRHGYQLSVAHSDRNAGLEAQQIASTPGSGASGLLLWPQGSATRRDALAALGRAGVPFVLIDRFLDDVTADHVVVDDRRGAREVTAHLTALGHRRIAFLHFEDLDISAVRLRHGGYRDALADHGIDDDGHLTIRLPGPAEADLFDNMAVLAGSVFQQPDAPTAAFCVNDHLAQALLVALGRRQVRVPEDVSIAGFDGLDYVPTALQLTTVRRSPDELGRAAVRLLIERIEGNAAAPRHLVLPTELVVRETTGPPRSVAGRSPVARPA